MSQETDHNKKKKNTINRSADRNQAKLIRKTNSGFKGVMSIVFGLLFLIFGVSELLDTFEPGSFLFSVILCIALVGLGIFFLKQPERDEKKEKALDDREKMQLKNQNVDLQKRREKYLAYSAKRKNLRYLFFVKSSWAWTQAVIISAMVLLPVWVLASAISAMIILYVYILIVLVIFYIIYCKNDKRYYDILLGQYKEHGLEKEEAKADFAESRFYRIGKEFIYVSSRFLFDSQSGFLIPVSDIVMVFTGYDKQYSPSVFSGVKASHYLVVCLENGKVFKLTYPEEICPVITEDIKDYGSSVTTGYSGELYRQYLSDPASFRYDYKAIDNITQQPVSTEIISNRRNVEGNSNIVNNKTVNDNTVNDTVKDEFAKKKPVTVNFVNNSNISSGDFKNLLENEKLIEERLTYKRPPQEYLDRMKACSESCKKWNKIQIIIFLLSGVIIFILCLLLCSFECPKFISDIFIILLAADILFKILVVKFGFNILKLSVFKSLYKKEDELYKEGLSKIDLPEVHDKIEIFIPKNKLDNDLWQCANLKMFSYSDNENLYLADILKTIRIPFESINLSENIKKGRIRFRIKDENPEEIRGALFIKADNLTVPFYTVKISVDGEIYDMCIPEYEMETFCKMTHVKMPGNSDV